MKSSTNKGEEEDGGARERNRSIEEEENVKAKISIGSR